MERMKILVIDDSPVHQEAARRQLGTDHDLTVVGYYSKGQELLCGWYEPGRTWDTGINRPPQKFDIVLCDLLMPASGCRLGSEGRKYDGQEMPVGIFLALLAAKNGCAKSVALFTDSSHHDHPASACLDDFNESESKPTAFTVGGVRVLLTNNRSWVWDGEKHWDMLLAYLVNPPDPKSSVIA